MWAIPVLIILCVLFCVYCLVPSYWARNLSSWVFRRGKTSKKYIALTFDDGPHPQYTPALLDILDKHEIKATFFLVGKRAEYHPDIVKRMKHEGHLIGCHSYSHHHAWLMPPYTTYKDMNKTYHILKDIIGHAPKWYRPPWGTFNLLSLYFAARLGITPAYWSIEAQDWSSKSTEEHIYNTVLKKAQKGDIIVLHDNGGDAGCPEKTLQAVPTIIITLKERGYTFVTLEELRNS